MFYRTIKNWDEERKSSKFFKDFKVFTEYCAKLDKACYDGKLEEVREIVIDLDIRNLRRSQTPEYVIFGNFKIENTFWNAFHIATEKGNTEIMRFLLEDCRIDSSSVGRLGSDKYNTDRSKNADYEAFPLFLALAGNHMDSFKFLWLDHGYFWDETHIIASLKILENLVQQDQKSQFIKLLLDSKTSSEIFNFLNIDAKVNFIKSIDQLGENLAPNCMEYIKNKPYTWAYLVYKGQEANKLKPKELKEISTVAKDIQKEDIETLISDKRSATSKVDEMMKSISKLENTNEDHFKLIKTVTQKMVTSDKLKKYKAEEDDGKVLLPIDENEKEDDDGEGEDNEGKGEDDEDKGEDDEGEGEDDEGEGEDDEGEGEDDEGKGEDDEVEGEDDEVEGEDDEVEGEDDEVEGEDDEGKGEDDEGEGEDDKEEEEKDDDNEMPDGETFCTYAEKGKLNKIKKAMQHPDFVDLIRLSGLEKQVLISDSEYNTEYWNPLLFAIFYNQTEIVKYLIEECTVNLVTCMMDPEVREKEFDKEGYLDWESLDGMFGYFLAAHKKNVDILDILWNGGRS